jgi:hypothetical protein
MSRQASRRNCLIRWLKVAFAAKRVTFQTVFCWINHFGLLWVWDADGAALVSNRALMDQSLRRGSAARFVRVVVGQVKRSWEAMAAATSRLPFRTSDLAASVSDMRSRVPVRI